MTRESIVITGVAASQRAWARLSADENVGGCAGSVETALSEMPALETPAPKRGDGGSKRWAAAGGSKGGYQAAELPH